MSGTHFVRVLAATLGACTFLGLAAGTAQAWPIPITPEQQNFIDQARGAGFPGGDDQILMAGQQACRALYMRQGVQGAIDTVAGPNGATPEQAAALVQAARGTLCTQAPG
ncbi:DUF732 domain-containing protein [Mycobacterium hackensackense]|uniref:DUF732 domain-containing protein n=1 Tax=Mycobacterium hackensackense TaxID=228909 RepID=UPI002265EB15|nr:DUF732 domain-containing protein [Mycobacterium hackensackense]MCV7251142.1 DUF732 domain-containing protein [Mycobacterium hackensackense]